MNFDEILNETSEEISVTKEENEFNYEDDEKYIDIEGILRAKISKNTVSMSIDTLIDKFNRFDFTLPKYQRKFIWETEQIKNLAISVIKNIPIPPIYVYLDNIDKKYVILDGQQRVISLFLYMNNLKAFKTHNGNKVIVDFYEILKDDETKTLIEKISNMEDRIRYFKDAKYYINDTLKSDDEEITFSKLSPNSKRIWGSRFIDVVFLEVNSDNKETVYSNIFNLLNSGGTPLKPQEIRNGVYKSEFYDMVHEINENTIWRKLYGMKDINNKDVEYLVRFFAIEYYTKIVGEKIDFKNNDKEKCVYNGNIHHLLDNFSQEAIKFSREYTEECRRNMVAFFKKFENYDFKNNDKKSIKLLLMESLYINYIKNNDLVDEFDSKLFNAIIEDDCYRKATRVATSHKKNVLDRLNIVMEKIKNGAKLY